MQDKNLFQAAAEDILAGYDFGDSAVEGISVWTTKPQADGGVAMECSVFLARDGGTRAVDLRVIINQDCSIDDAYALDRESGSRVGDPVFWGHEKTGLQVYLHGAGSYWRQEGESYAKEAIDGEAGTLFRVEPNEWQCWNVNAPNGESFSRRSLVDALKMADVMSERSRINASAGHHKLTVFVQARALDEYDDGPSFARLYLDEASIRDIERMSKLCRANGLNVVMADAPFGFNWGPDSIADDLRIQYENVVVDRDSFWLEGSPKHADYKVECDRIDIADVRAWFDAKEVLHVGSEFIRDEDLCETLIEENVIDEQGNLVPEDAQSEEAGA